MKRTIALTVLVLALFSLGLIAPVSAQGATWYAQYYNNPTLSGTPALSRYEGNINFNWGTGTPAVEVQADNFSARFAADIAFQPGTYRFFLLADDNARVTFNFSQPVIDTFTSGQVGQTVSGDVVIGAAGVYHIQIDYREVESLAYLYFSYANAATNPQPPFGTPPPTGGGTTIGLPSPWTAQYYANTALAGDPAAIVTVPSLNFNIGVNAPIGSVPADNWSARFTSVQGLSGGLYTLRVNVDDGVRVFINGALVINQLSGAVGQTLQAQVTLPAGASNFQVDYVEYTANAFLDLQLLAATPVVPTSAPITGASAIVTAYRLNVRQAPDPFAAIVTRINRNEQYPVLGRNAAGTWYLLQVGTVQGWSSAGYLSVVNGAGVPIVDGTVVQPTAAPAPPVTGITVLANPYTVNIRSGPGTTSSRIGRLPAGQSAVLIGRNAANQWWQINYNGIVGWVTAQYTVIVPAGANIGSIPVTG